ncbi:MAG TPA: DUF3108 domain-containing protein [Steroidobacteraceae bacterium]|nr:DUF3108 domain-containing protein [Steroidobacteraceae bacterium]
MRTLASLLTSMVMTVLVASSAQAEAAVPRPFSATYAVTFRGIGAGSITFDFARDAATGRYIYETHASPSTLARLFVSKAAMERSVMEIDGAGTRPIDWQLDDGKSGNEGDGELHFDWSRNRVTGTVEGKPVELTAEPGTQDRSSMQIAVTTALLRGVEPGTIPLIDDNRIKRYVYTKKENATVDSALGKLDTVLYESTREGGSSRTSRFWMAPSLEFLPVRAEQIRKGRVETVMVLQKLEHH